MSDHLSQTQLAGYSRRTLEPHELLAVDGHLASCDVCHERLTRILPGPSFKFHEEPFHLDYEQHLKPYVDGKADDIDREIVDSHVALCSKCADDLRDLLAFKEQPVAANTGNARTSSPWKQWLPQWAFLSGPAWAVAAVIAVLILAMAVFLWTKYQTSQQAKTGSPEPVKQTPALEKEQPSPASTEHGADRSTPPREEPLITLNDAGRQVTVNQHGQLEGLRELPPDLKESVRKALATRQLGASPALTGWSTGAGSLRGELDQQSTFAPLEPMDVVIETDRPKFRWRTLAAAIQYVVTIYDAKLRQVASSGPVTGTEWTTPNPLERGVTYSWQISALKDGKTVVSPKPPLPEARFRILDQIAVAALVKLKESAGNSHLAMGVFYWKHGLIDESQREFQALAKANPNSPTVAELLRSIHRR